MNNVGTMCYQFLCFGLHILTKEHNLNELAQFLSNAASLTDQFIRNRMYHIIDGISYNKDVSIFIKICHGHYRSPPLEPLEPSSPLAAATALNSLGDTLSTDAARCTGSFTSTPSSLSSTTSTGASFGTNR